jgi:hypothetical protein
MSFSKVRGIRLAILFLRKVNPYSITRMIEILQSTQLKRTAETETPPPREALEK